MRPMSLLTLLLLPTTGCIRAMDRSWEEPATDLSAVLVQTDRGDLGVEAVPGSETVRIDVSYEGLGFGAMGVSRQGDLLIVDISCGSLSACGGEIRLQLPPDLPAELEMDAGDVDIRGMAAPLWLRLGAGDVRVEEQSGEVELALGAGDVDLHLRDPGRRTFVDLGAGDARVDLPAGAYDLQLHVGTGEISSQGVDDDPAAERLLDLSVGSGALQVQGG